MQLQVQSITLLPSHATLNGTLTADASASGTGMLPGGGQSFNLPVSLEQVYDKTYEAGKTYPFTLGEALQPSQPTDTTPRPTASPASAG